MRKPNYQFKPKQKQRGVWTYSRESMGMISIKKGENYFKDHSERFEGISSVRIGKLIYDIEKIEDSTVYLTEGVEEDYSGEMYIESQLPILIKDDLPSANLAIDYGDGFEKSKHKVIPIHLASKDMKMKYLNIQDETKGKVEKDGVFLMVVDTIADDKLNMKNSFMKQILDLVFHIDMDYEIEDGVSLWDNIGIKKGDYIALAYFMVDNGRLSNLDDIATLKYTIEAIKSEIDVEEHIATSKLKSTQLQLQMLTNKMKQHFESEEDFKKFAGLE